jgi:Major intrinsic protein
MNLISVQSSSLRNRERRKKNTSPLLLQILAKMVKLAFGSAGDSFSATSIKSYLAEFIATLLFVFAGVGSAIAYGIYIYVS